MKSWTVLLLPIAISACGKKEDPVRQYIAAKECFEAATGYKVLSDDPAIGAKYDGLLRATSTVIEAYEADAPELFARPGDAKREAEASIQIQIATASTTDERAALIAKYSKDASKCAERFN